MACLTGDYWKYGTCVGLTPEQDKLRREYFDAIRKENEIEDQKRWAERVSIKYKKKCYNLWRKGQVK